MDLLIGDTDNSDASSNTSRTQPNHFSTRNRFYRVYFTTWIGTYNSRTQISKKSSQLPTFENNHCFICILRAWRDDTWNDKNRLFFSYHMVYMAYSKWNILLY